MIGFTKQFRISQCQANREARLYALSLKLMEKETMNYRKSLLTLLTVSLLFTTSISGSVAALNASSRSISGEFSNLYSQPESTLLPEAPAGTGSETESLAEAESNATTPTGWGWYYNQTAGEINELGKQNNLRPITVVPNGLIEHTPRFHVLFVKNTGIYKVVDWAFASTRTIADAKKLSDPKFRLAGYRVSNVAWHLYKNNDLYDTSEWRIATIMVSDNQYLDYDVRVNLTYQELMALPGQGFRVADIDEAEIGEGGYRYNAVIVPNKGEHYKNWAWLFNVSRSGLLEKAKDINGKPFRITDIERRDDGRYTALLVETRGEVVNWYSNLTSDAIKNDVLRRHGSWIYGKLHGGARLFDMVTYKDNNTDKFEVLTMENGLGEYPIARDNVAGFEEFDKQFIKTMSRHGVPGASFALSKNGKVIYRAAYGFADLKNATPATQYSRGRLASISKTFTAAAIMKLIEQKKNTPQGKPLTLDSQVFGENGILKSLKPFSYSGYKGTDAPNLESITVRHLLTHTAGWDRGTSGDPAVEKDTDPYTCDGNSECEPTISIVQKIAQHAKNEGSLDKNATRGANLDEIIRWMMKPDDKDYLPAWKPGTKQVYSNFGYTVLQKIVEVVSGKMYSLAIQDMENAMGVSFYPGNSDPVNPVQNEWRYHDVPGATETTSVAWSSAKLDNPIPRPYWYDMNAMLGHGGWVTTPTDLVKFAAKMDSSAPNPWISQATFLSMMQRPSCIKANDYTYYGLNWSVDQMGNDTDGKFRYSHGGRLNGASSLLLKGWYHRKVSMAFLFNSTADASGGEVQNGIEPLIGTMDDNGVLAGLAK
jgi:N-acyl-D-amino-acid deacylase